MSIPYKKSQDTISNPKSQDNEYVNLLLYIPFFRLNPTQRETKLTLGILTRLQLFRNKKAGK